MFFGCRFPKMIYSLISIFSSAIAVVEVQRFHLRIAESTRLYVSIRSSMFIYA